MLRPLLVALLATSMLPAAPVPAPRQVFGSGGWVSRESLEKLAFKRVPADKVKGARDILDRKKVARDAASTADASLAVFMPRRTFAAGEPVPVYFALRNTADKPLGLDARLDLFGNRLGVRNGGDVIVRNLHDDTRLYLGGERCMACGGPPAVVVPAKGFYCVKADLARYGDLPPGEYAVRWRCEDVYSEEAAFTVTHATAKVPTAKRPVLRLARLDDPDDGEKVHAVETVDAREFAAALSVGVCGRYYPDPHELPDSSPKVTVEAKWVKADEVLRVTVRSRVEGKEVRLADAPTVYLLATIESDGDNEQREELAKAKKEVEKAAERKTPWSKDFTLPKDWRRRLEIDAKASIEVVVCGAKPEMPREREITAKVAERLGDEPRDPLGVVRVRVR